MKDYMIGKLSGCLRRVAIAIVTSGLVAAPAAYARASSNIILVPPTDLPELARQSGDAMPRVVPRRRPPAQFAALTKRTRGW